jgi:nondiscriminating glutamyl-tRNA synthetase
MSVRVRFAPSPTGWIHIGSLRTVLFDYLLAKQQNGSFILRVEDTDQKREVKNGIEGIVESLEIAGLIPNEGYGYGGEYGPYIQSQRLDIYNEYVQKLLENDHAYYCFCTKERLEKLTEEQKRAKLKTQYDGHCRKLTKQEVEEKLKSNVEKVIRLKVPANETIFFEDEVYGKITFKSDEVNDQVLIKADGFPTYHFAVVVDDYLMKVTHILRGEDWLPSTPKQVLLYRAFGWEMPKFVHVPNVLNPNRIGKLSKRKGASTGTEFIRKGYLREALINFLALVGWNPDPKVANQNEFYTEEFLIEHFDVKRIKRSGGAFDNQKFDAINAMWIMHFTPEELLQKVYAWNDVVQRGFVADEIIGDKEQLAIQRKNVGMLVEFFRKNESKAVEFIKLAQPRIKKLEDLWDWYEFIFNNVWDKEVLTPFENVNEKVSELKETIMKLNTWDQEPWEAAIRGLADKFGMKHGDLFMILRVVVTGRKVSPPLRDIMVILGKEFVEQKFTGLLGEL